jgi:hypothetical protein
MESENNEVKVEPIVQPKVKRVVTNEDIVQYEPMVQKFIRDSCVKNWIEARGGNDVPLGTSGYTLNDLRQHLRTEICIALQNFNPNYLTKEGRTVKESTFVFQHLTFRIGQLMKRLTKKRNGYGIHHAPVHLVIESGVEESNFQNIDLAQALDKRAELTREKKSQVERFLETKYGRQNLCDK